MKRFVIAAAALAAILSQPALADETGISFWLPGQFGSLAAVPSVPGLSFASVFYHTDVKAGGGMSFARGGQVDLGVKAKADAIIFGPTYVFADPFLGAQASVTLLAVGGRMRADVDATLAGPGGAMVSGTRSETLEAFGDLYPQASLKWNRGVHNFMTYVSGDIPVGAYSPSRIANLGIGHGAIDGGGGYTYFNPQTGREFSAVTGLTYNLRNPDTDYKNGLDWHVDWGASQFLSERFHIGLVGYWYQQITGDSGSGATLGDFKSRVGGIGPQVGFIFPVAGIQGYLNLKAYREFAAQNRPEGWNAWVTFAISPAPPPSASSKH